MANKRACFCMVENENDIYAEFNISHIEIAKLNRLVRDNKDLFSEELVKHISILNMLQHDAWMEDPKNPLIDMYDGPVRKED